MAEQGKSRRRILREIQFMQQQTKSGEPINIKKMQEYLDEYSAIRQIIYSDLSIMEEMGAGVVHKKNGRYYYDRQSFSGGELALMIDLVCCAGYPDIKSAKELILHIKQMGNDDEFDALSHHEHLALRNKTDNLDCINNTNIIHKAIREDKKIHFIYAHADKYGKNILDKEHVISPYQLLWNDSRLYLIGGNEYKNAVKQSSFRVDKIYDLKITDQKRKLLANNNPFYNDDQGFDGEKYLNSTFDMYNSKDGKTTQVTFCIENKLAGTALDRFGKDIKLKEYDQEHMTFTAEIQVSNMFFGWLAKFTYGQMHIVRPKRIVDGYRKHLQNIIDKYDYHFSSASKSPNKWTDSVI